MIDPAPLAGSNYYRLKQIDLDGRVTIFPIRHLDFSGDAIKSLSVYPNPVQGNMLNVNVQGVGERKLTLYNQAGQKINEWNISGADTFMQLNLPGQLAAGVYMITLVSGDQIWTERVIVE